MRAALTALLLAGAVAVRLALWTGTPVLSDDVYRYLWDGRVQRAGINPYIYAPDDPALAHLRDGDWRNINHQSVRTIYPPFAQAMFRLAAKASPTIAAQKAMFLFWDVATLALLVKILKARGANPLWAGLYTWHPLVLLEFSHSGHCDSLAIFWMLLGVHLLDRDRPGWAGAALGLSFLAKLGTGLLLPALLVRRAWRPAVLPLLATVALGYLPFLDGWRIPLGGTGAYASSWSFNASVFDLLAAAAPATQIRIGLMIGLVGLSVILGRSGRGAVESAFALFAAALALSPVVHPWYAAWLVPFLVLQPRPAWLAWTFTVLLSYAVLPLYAATGRWALPLWIRLVEYSPLGIGWLVWVARTFGTATSATFRVRSRRRGDLLVARGPAGTVSQ